MEIHEAKDLRAEIERLRDLLIAQQERHNAEVEDLETRLAVKQGELELVKAAGRAQQELNRRRTSRGGTS